MNVLVVGGDYYCGSIYPLAVAGLRRNGCRATGIGYRSFVINRPAWTKILARARLHRFLPPLYRVGEWMMDRVGNRWYQRRNRDRILSALARDRYEVLLVIKGDNLTRELIEECKQRYPDLQIAIWFLDHPLLTFTEPPQLWQETYRALGTYDLLCCFDDYYLDELRALTGKPTLHLPLAYDEEQFYPLGVKKTVLAGLVGSAMPNRVAMLRRVPEVVVSGPGWPADLPAHRRGRLTVAEVNQLYNETLINLNMNHPQSVYDYNNKLFEITGSGNFLLTDYKRNLDRHYDVGREVETFRTEDELREKLAYYSVHPDAAERIGRAGRVRALRDHTYRTRMQTLLGELARLRALPGRP